MERAVAYKVRQRIIFFLMESVLVLFQFGAVVSQGGFQIVSSILNKEAQSNYGSNYKSQSETSRSTLHAGVDTAIIVVSVAAINVVQQPVHQENQQLVPLP